MNLINAPFHEWSPFLFILLAGALPTQIWRWAGALLSANLKEDSELLRWVKAVATALVSGLVANLVIFPSGVLNDIPLIIRILALLCGFGVYFLNPSRIVWGILAGEVVLLVGSVYFS